MGRVIMGLKCNFDPGTLNGNGRNKSQFRLAFKCQDYFGCVNFGLVEGLDTCQSDKI
jgi:hypothetical protein